LRIPLEYAGFLPRNFPLCIFSPHDPLSKPVPRSISSIFCQRQGSGARVVVAPLPFHILPTGTSESKDAAFLSVSQKNGLFCSSSEVRSVSSNSTVRPALVPSFPIHFTFRSTDRRRPRVALQIAIFLPFSFPRGRPFVPHDTPSKCVHFSPTAPPTFRILVLNVDSQDRRFPKLTLTDLTVPSHLFFRTLTAPKGESQELPRSFWPIPLNFPHLSRHLPLLPAHSLFQPLKLKGFRLHVSC